MMVLHDFVSKRITPLQECTRPTLLYTGVNDVTRLERGDRSVLGEEALALVMGKPSPDPSSHDITAGGDAFNGRRRHCTGPEGCPVPWHTDPWDRRHGWLGSCCPHSGPQQGQGEGGASRPQRRRGII
jgi:hypothetical protein